MGGGGGGGGGGGREFPTRSDTNGAVKPKNMARCLKLWIKRVEGLYCLCSKNKGADHLCGYCTADLHFVLAYEKSRFSHEEAQMRMHYINKTL